MHSVFMYVFGKKKLENTVGLMWFINGALENPI